MNRKQRATDERAKMAAKRRRERQESLGGILADLRGSIARRALDRRAVSNACRALENVNENYRYDDGAFPQLTDTHQFVVHVGTTPTNLAEAMLWKLGRWKAYKRFAANYKDPLAEPTTQDVVLFGFARHLKDKSRPIYDQHAIRAIWAIDDNLTPAESAICKSVLFDTHHKWKASGSGSDTIDCYNLFVRRVANLAPAEGNVTNIELDRLLMPLGQAIKELTGSYEEFMALCQAGAGASQV